MKNASNLFVFVHIPPVKTCRLDPLMGSLINIYNKRTVNLISFEILKFYQTNKISEGNQGNLLYYFRTYQFLPSVEGSRKSFLNLQVLFVHSFWVKRRDKFKNISDIYYETFYVFAK